MVHPNIKVRDPSENPAPEMARKTMWKIIETIEKNPADEKARKDLELLLKTLNETEKGSTLHKAALFAGTLIPAKQKPESAAAPQPVIMTRAEMWGVIESVEKSAVIDAKTRQKLNLIATRLEPEGTPLQKSAARHYERLSHENAPPTRPVRPPVTASRAPRPQRKNLFRSVVAFIALIGLKKHVAPLLAPLVPLLSGPRLRFVHTETETQAETKEHLKYLLDEMDAFAENDYPPEIHPAAPWEKIIKMDESRDPADNALTLMANILRLAPQGTAQHEAAKDHLVRLVTRRNASEIFNRVNVPEARLQAVLSREIGKITAARPELVLT